MFTREQHIMRRRFSQNKNVPLLHLLCMASIYQCKTSIGSKYFLAYGQLNRRCEMPQIDQINHNLLCRPLTQIKVYSFHSFFIAIAIYQQKTFLFNEHRLHIFSDIFIRKTGIFMLVSVCFNSKQKNNQCQYIWTDQTY